MQGEVCRLMTKKKKKKVFVEGIVPSTGKITAIQNGSHYNILHVPLKRTCKLFPGGMSLLLSV